VTAPISPGHKQVPCLRRQLSDAPGCREPL